MQHAVVAAFVMGLDSMISKTGYFFTYKQDEDNFSIQLWKGATKSEAGDAHRVLDTLINRQTAEMNDVRLHWIAKHVEQSCYNFIKECRTGYKLNLYPESGLTMSDLVSFGNYLLQTEDRRQLKDVTHADLEKWKHKMLPKHDIESTPESDFVRSFGPNEFPPFEDEEQAASVDVLIDVNGERTDFAIGYYSFTDKTWRYKDGFTDTTILRWFHLPLAKYDKHKVK